VMQTDEYHHCDKFFLNANFHRRLIQDF